MFFCVIVDTPFVLVVRLIVSGVFQNRRKVMKKILTLTLFVFGSTLGAGHVLANTGSEPVGLQMFYDREKELEGLMKKAESRNENPLVLAMRENKSFRLVPIYLESVGLGKDSDGHLNDKYDSWVPSYLESTLKKGGAIETVYLAIKYAIENNHKEWIVELLKAPRLMRVQKRNLERGNKTFLMEAAHDNNLPIVELLLANGEDPNQVWEEGEGGRTRKQQVALDMATHPAVIAALKQVTSKRWFG